MNQEIHDRLLDKRTSALVSIERTKPDKETVFSAVKSAMEKANWKEYITPNAIIALKPNLGWDKLIPGAISAPWVVEAVVLVIKDYASEIFIVESDQVVCKADEAVRMTGIYDICQRYDISWINMSKGNFIEYKLKDRIVLHHVKIPEILSECELITLPLMKTHNKTTITGAVKNQWGCLQELRHNFHPVLPQALVDVSWFTQPRFAVMDGTIGLEGNGPKSGIPKEMNLVLASGNLVGIDATAARIMGFDPKEIEHLVLCAEHGFGSLAPNTTGLSIEDVKTKFVPAKHNLVSITEILFRNSFFSRLVFHTPLFKIMTWATRRYYDLWDLFVGRNIRKRISSSGYFKAYPNQY